MKKFTCLFLALLLLNCSSWEEDSIPEDYLTEVLRKRRREQTPTAVALEKDNPKPILVHYMAWFQSLEYDGYWGQHWTMTNHDPNILDQDGKSQIASNYYPKIGPYSSKDPDLQEYHLLLMKLSGVDGVVFDWYGSRNINDYHYILSATESFIEQIEKTGLKFSIMYEDRVAEQTMEVRATQSTLEAAMLDMTYIDQTYFTSPNYLRLNSKELLFFFGPNHIIDSEDWQHILARINCSPEIFTLWGASDRVGNCTVGEFSWIDPLHLDNLLYYYNYTLTSSIRLVGGVYPGFDDYYYEGGWKQTDQYDWEIDHLGTETFNQTLELSDLYPADFLQIITWNDFGEGTMIEPTDEFGFSFLEQLQLYTGAETTLEDLTIPLRLYQYRKLFKGDQKVQNLLDKVFNDVITLKLHNANQILNAIESSYQINTSS